MTSTIPVVVEEPFSILVVSYDEKLWVSSPMVSLSTNWHAVDTQQKIYIPPTGEYN